MKIKIIILLFLILISNILFVQQIDAKESSNIGSYSIERFVASTINNKDIKKLVQQRDKNEAVKKRSERQNVLKSYTLQANHSQQYSHYVSFEIYSATTQLITDIDGDGYYHNFAITFDADLNSNYSNTQATVYANLYIRRAGEPWTLYYSTDNFMITDNITDDAYQVETFLDTGFSTGYYDILIDLIDSSSNELLVTYSADDDNTLYALPLESADYDPEYIEVEIISVEESAGSSSWLLILMSLMILFIRIKQNMISNNE